MTPRERYCRWSIDGNRNRGRPKLRWRDLVKDNMARNQITTEMAEDRRHWHVMIRAKNQMTTEMGDDRKRCHDSSLHTTKGGGGKVREKTAHLLKLKFRQHPATHTNYSLSNCTISKLERFKLI